MIESDRIKPGTIVAYKLPPSDRPANPNKIWRGKVISSNRGGVLVELLEPGYAGLREYVQAANIVGAA